MCRRVQCASCGKPSFAGCGMHVEQVLSDVPREKRCHCNESAAKEPKPEGSFFGRVFGGASQEKPKGG